MMKMRRRRPFIRRRITRRVPRYRRGDSTRFFKVKSQVQVNGATTVSTLAVTDVLNAGVGNYASISAMFSHVRVCGIKFKWFPTHNQSLIASANGYFPLQVIHDRNLTAPASLSIDQVLQYDNVRTFNAFRPWKVYRRMANQLKFPGQASVSFRGFQPSTNLVSTQQMILWVPQLANPSALGTLQVTYYVAARNLY